MASVDLTPRLPKKVQGGNGGSYHSWSPSDLPMLQHGNIGAAKLALEKNGFALPRYSDSSMVAYVLQGINRLIFISASLIDHIRYISLLVYIRHI